MLTDGVLLSSQLAARLRQRGAVSHTSIAATHRGAGSLSLCMLSLFRRTAQLEWKAIWRQGQRRSLSGANGEPRLVAQLFD
jgi:hypothetical protein